jgi:hypothetical protein
LDHQPGSGHLENWFQERCYGWNTFVIASPPESP